MYGSITLNNKDLCRIGLNHKNIHGRGGVHSPSLMIQPKMTMCSLANIYANGDCHYSITSLSGWAVLEKGPHRENIPLVNFTVPEVIAKSYMFYGEQYFKIYLVLDPLRTSLIEDVRQGGDVKLKLEGSASLSVQRVENNEHGLYPIGVICYETAELRLDVEIPQSYWVKTILPQLGWGEFILIETRTDASVLDTAHEYLNKAQKAFDNWDMASVAVNCREMVKTLNRSLSQRLGKTNPSYSVNWNKAAFGKAEEFMSLGQHESDISAGKKLSYSFTRADAEFAISYARILMRYAQELYHRKE